MQHRCCKSGSTYCCEVYVAVEIRDAVDRVQGPIIACFTTTPTENQRRKIISLGFKRACFTTTPAENQRRKILPLGFKKTPLGFDGGYTPRNPHCCADVIETGGRLAAFLRRWDSHPVVNGRDMPLTRRSRQLVFRRGGSERSVSPARVLANTLLKLSKKLASGKSLPHVCFNIGGCRDFRLRAFPLSPVVPALLCPCER